jgi:allantoicase
LVKKKHLRLLSYLTFFLLTKQQAFQKMSTTPLSLDDESYLPLDKNDRSMVEFNGIDDTTAKVGMTHAISIVDVAHFDKQEETKDETNLDFLQPPFLVGCDQDVVNATSSGAGAQILFATDEWFATADNLLKDSPPHFDPNEYCEQGKVMDGWETRRRREAGHDWCLIRLSDRVRSIVGIEIDTAHFTGNNAPAISIEIADISSCDDEIKMISKLPNALSRLLYGCVQGSSNSPSEVAVAESAVRTHASWKVVLPKTPLNPGYEQSRLHYFTFLDSDVAGTHLRVNYFPDGGVARLRLWGCTKHNSPRPRAGPAYSPISTGARCTIVSHGIEELMPSKQPSEYTELSCLDNGGLGLVCSNKHYGEPVNLLQSTLGVDMGDGWETARHPNRPQILVQNPNTGLVDSNLSDWCILKLGAIASSGVVRIILDTKHFRGNYPESVKIEGCFCPDEDDELFWVEDSESNIKWVPLIDRIRMAPDSEHVFERAKDQILNSQNPISHVRVTTYPDGGISRVRVYG